MTSPPPEVHVVGVALVRDGRCLVAQRAPQTSFGLCWEFPGGKVEAGERPREALVRELTEELGVRVRVGEYLGHGEVDLGSHRIVLQVFAGQLESGEPRALEHRQLRWCSVEELGELEWAQADVPIVPAVQAWLEERTREWRSPHVVNEFGQPVGVQVNDSAGSTEFEEELQGERCLLQKLSSGRHGADLFRALVQEGQGEDWTYLSHGPYATESEFRDHLVTAEQKPGYTSYALLDRRTSQAVGSLSLLRAQPRDRCIEVGAIHFGRSIQQSPIGTEAIFLLARYVFDTLGYRRLEWKCDALNRRSRESALRLGFRFEGVFEKHMIYKGRNRDTAWYAIVDDEWPLCREALVRWLSPGNFDENGRQRRSLRTIREASSDEP